MKRLALQDILETFGAQLGEIAWYDANLDPRIDSVVDQQSSEMREAIKSYLGDRNLTSLRLLEVGAYRHFSMHLLGDEFNCATAMTDISATSLRFAAEAARQKGLSARPTLAACDFHDLPFATGYFDFVYIASAVHHTWRTRIVLEELLRVTAPGGVLMLANEPVKRELCFYQFRSNRPDSFCAWEREIDRAGLMHTISSPFLGSRDEEVFGMIENDQIPWSVFEEFLSTVDVLEQTLSPVEHDFERSVLAKTMSSEELADAIEHKLAPLRNSRDVAAAALGFSAPDWPQVISRARAVAPLLNTVNSSNGQAALIARSKLFGAALRAIVRKRQTGERSDCLWRRYPPLVDGAYVENPKLPNLEVGIEKIELPAFTAANKDALAEIFKPGDWTMYQEDSGNWSLLMNDTEGTIHLPSSSADGVLLLRFYGVAQEGRPYRVVAELDGTEQASVEIVQSESRMIPILVNNTSSKVRLRALYQDGGKPEKFTYHIRLAVCRRVPINYSMAHVAE